MLNKIKKDIKTHKSFYTTLFIGTLFLVAAILFSQSPSLNSILSGMTGNISRLSAVKRTALPLNTVKQIPKTTSFSAPKSVQTQPTKGTLTVNVTPLIPGTSFRAFYKSGTLLSPGIIEGTQPIEYGDFFIRGTSINSEIIPPPDQHFSINDQSPNVTINVVFQDNRTTSELVVQTNLPNAAYTITNKDTGETVFDQNGGLSLTDTASTMGGSLFAKSFKLKLGVYVIKYGDIDGYLKPQDYQTTVTRVGVTGYTKGLYVQK